MAWSTPEGRYNAQRCMGLSIDGVMINIVGEGWKELKLVCVFDVELRSEKDAHTGDVGEFGHAVRPSYVAHLGGPQVFGWQAWTEAQRRGWHGVGATQLVADRAAWIWNLHAEHFHDSVGVVDWYHAMEHLAEAKQHIYPQAGLDASQWLNSHAKALYQGRARQIARDVIAAAERCATPECAKVLRTAAGYFDHNYDRMQYQDFRDDGWLIGSSTVESGAKQFKARFSGSGMRWSRHGAENLIPVRAAVMTSRERFDGLWAAAFGNSPQN